MTTDTRRASGATQSAKKDPFIEVQPEVIQDARELETALIQAGKVVDTARGDTVYAKTNKRLVRLAEAFVSAASIYGDSLSRHVRDLQESNKAGRFEFSQVIGFKPVTPEQFETRIRAEFTIQAANSTVKNCFDFRQRAYEAYRTAANPPSEAGKASHHVEPQRSSGLLAGVLQFAGLQRV